MERRVLLLVILLPFLLSAQTFNSKTTGGHWNTASTWVEGSVPTDNSNVVINGLVVISNQTCNNLTINASGIIEDEPSAGRSLTVKGNFINYGTVRIGSGNAGVDLYVIGSVQNYGTLIQRHLRFSGSGTQQFTSTKKISCLSIDKVPDGSIQAMSDIEIDSVTTINLSNDILNMGSFKLTKHSKKDINNATQIIFGGTVFSNGLLDISGRFGSDLDGAFTLTGTTPLLFVGGNTIKQNLTVGIGKTIADEPSAGRDIRIIGNVINNGTITNRFAFLWLKVQGNVVNNGNFLAHIRFEGNDNQTISGTQKFTCVGIDKFPNGKINAASDLIFDSTTTINLADDVLNMGSYKLTKLSQKDIYNSSHIITNGTIFSNGLLDISGRFGSNLDGEPTLIGTTPLLFVGGNIVNKNLRIGAGKVVADEPSAGRGMFINGNLTNEGIIKNRFAGLTVHVKGNVINNGDFSAYLRLNGGDDQKISGTKKYSCIWIDKHPSGKFSANSDIVIDTASALVLNDDIFYMGSYKLTKLSKKDLDYSDFIIKGGTLHSNGELDITGRFGSNLDGDFILTGSSPMLFVGGNIIYKNLKVAKDKIIQDECCAGRAFSVMGDILNFGIIKNRHGGLTTYAYGNVNNYGQVEISWLVLRSNNNTLKLTGVINSNISLEKSGGTSANVDIEGLVRTNKRFYINAGVILNVLNGAELNVYKTIENLGTINNYGKLSSRYYIYGSGQVDSQKETKLAPWIYDRATSDSVLVTVNNSIHPKMSSSIKRWWNFQGNKKLNTYVLDLYYEDSILNGQDPNSLDAYLTTDKGVSWKKISNPINIKRDLVNKKITVGNANSLINFVGDIILSSGNVANLPSISLAIGGRKEVRVGPPNRYTISYWNNNNYPTDLFFIKLNTNQGVYIDAVQSKRIGSNTIDNIPVDSLVYDNRKDEVLLMVQPLGPKEVRSFDVIIKSAIGSSFKTTEPITFTAALLWIGGAIVQDYIENTIVAGCYEMWRPVRHDESLTDASVKALKNSLNKAVTVENGVKAIASNGAEEIIKKTTGAVIWPAKLAYNVYECLGNTIKGMKDYVNGNFDKQEKELVKVNSWDPNAKEGPTGYGSGGFMASTAPMNYTIFFENKKEATAPAYQIVILDTLDANVYDINSVVFGSTSHPAVKPTITKIGNVLKWDFVAIELVPNVKPPEGEGWVKFTVNLKPNLPTGTQIKNKASITFDINKPIITNVSLNTLDFDKPTSNISAITKVAGKNEVAVNWTGDDGKGAGVKNAVIYLALGDGPFTIAAISDKSPVNIPVQINSNYKFYVLASDNVGNTQITPTKIHEVTTEIKKIDEVPSKYSLEQNYPNPFNPTTSIKFSIPERTNVTLDIYNVLGERVAQLVNAEVTAGNYDVKFNAINLSSGIYLYQLKTPNFKLSRKMLLIK